MTTEQLVPARYIMLALGQESYGTPAVLAFLKKHKIPVKAEMAYGKGIARLVAKADADRAVAAELAERGPKTSTESETSSQAHEERLLHLGALEAKADRIEAEIIGLHQAMGEFTKASNLIADRLNKVLQQLGVS